MSHVRTGYQSQSSKSKSSNTERTRLGFNISFPHRKHQINHTCTKKKKTEVANDTQLPIVDYVFKRKTPFAVSKQQSTQGEGIFYLKFNCFW